MNTGSVNLSDLILVPLDKINPVSALKNKKGSILSEAKLAEERRNKEIIFVFASSFIFKPSHFF